ncbi:MAG TPA: AI-2E family transporter [Patescibacteria group bacterium]|nr:AI-2E family transporter [Patescibacteria group bacterium]
MINSRVEISIKTILITLSFIVIAWLLVLIRDILFLLFIAFLLMTAIHPVVSYLERLHIPKIVGILLVYIVLFGFFGVTVISALPTLIIQFGRLIQALPTAAGRIIPYGNLNISSISQQIAPIGASLVNVTFGIFSNIVTFLTVFAFTFYFLLERHQAEEIITSVLGESLSKDIMVLLRSIERRLGLWVRGELLLMTAVGLMSFIGLSILRVDFALPLAILAGSLELVPMIGPVLGAIPAVIVGLATSPFLALSVIALYIIVQQLENNVLVPVIMRKSVGLAPIITILVLLIGGRLAGVVGAILAVPVALVIQELLTHYVTKSAMSGLRQRTKNSSKT